MLLKPGTKVYYIHQFDTAKSPKGTRVLGTAVTREQAYKAGLEEEIDRANHVVAYWEDSKKIQAASIKHCEMPSNRKVKNLPSWW